MAFYRQSEACPKFGTAQGGGSSSGAGWGRDNYPRSYAVDAPAKLLTNMETMTGWDPYNGLEAPTPYRGGWDELGGRLMHVPQAGTYYTGPPNPWPANGVDDQPNAYFNLVRLEPTTSAHPGYMNPTGPGPSMIFAAPPIFGIQTNPVPAFGV